ncbi:MAG: Imm1 family immunity protein [Gemmatales bacterium]
MRVEEYSRSLEVTDVKELAAALHSRDERGGALFCLTPDENERYPSLVIRVTKDYADVHYFPCDGHPGFRCLGGVDLPETGWTRFVYKGCDPEAGEGTPNKFIIPFDSACAIAEEFLRSSQRSHAVDWFEL